MSDRYRGYAPPARSPTYNPARSSMPSNIGYSSMYAGDVHSTSSSARVHPVTTPRGYSTTVNPSGVPTTTRTYAVTHDPRSSHGSHGHDAGRSRRSTLESSARPPVIVTTTTAKDRPHAGSSQSSGNRSGSPVREEYRGRDGRLSALAAPTIRSRSAARPYSASYDPEEYIRPKDRRDSGLTARDAEAYRSSRPSVAYPSDPRHSNAAAEYGDEDYSYTNPSELARYDLDQSRPVRGAQRRESLDRGYYRPSVGSGSDASRGYNVGSGRASESDRSRPPPSTRGFDRISRGYDDPRDAPPPISATPHSSSSHHDRSGSSIAHGEGRRRPVSLYQDLPSDKPYHDDSYRTRESHRSSRDMRQPERSPHLSQFRDDSVTSRGFGIRTDHVEGSRRSSDEGTGADPDERRRSRQELQDDRYDRRHSKRDSDEDERDRSRLRDKVASGMGIAAAAVGLSSKDGEKRDKETVEPPRRRSPTEDRHHRRESEDRSRDYERERERERDREGERLKERHGSRSDGAVPERPRREADVRASEEAVGSPSDSDEARKTKRRHRPSHGFNPNDTSDLKQLKEQLAAKQRTESQAQSPTKPHAFDPNNTADLKQIKEQLASKDHTERERKISPVANGEPPEPRKSASPSLPAEALPVDESRSRELVVPSPEGRQVRVVSPPRDKRDDKPLKGILKQPKSSFPEDNNPVREGVAPHKDDKKFKEAPPGAKWTKINRRVVNPDALTIGKERFEVRDDFVIVLRVLSKEEIQAYATATQVLRDRKRAGEVEGRDHEKDGDGTDSGHGKDEDDSKRHHRHHHHRHRSHDRDGDEADRDDSERERRRRRRREREAEDEEHERQMRDLDRGSRSQRERERAVEA